MPTLARPTPSQSMRDSKQYSLHVTSMYQFCRTPSVKRHIALIGLFSAITLLSACSSPEERAKRYYEHGQQLVAAHDDRRAAIEFLNAVRYNKKLMPAWQSLALVEERLHNWNNLVPVLRSILELDPHDISARIKLGRLLLVGGAFEDALRLVNDASGEESQSAGLIALKAAILFKLNDSAGAVREAQAALKIDPVNTEAMFVLAGNAFVRGDVKAALDILNSDAMRQKNDIGIELFKLQILEKTQDLQQAEVLLQKLIELYPKEVAFKKELIRLYVLQHRNDDAENTARSIVAADPGNVQAQLELVQLLRTIKGPAAAQQELIRLVNSSRDAFPYQIALAQLNFAQANFAESESLLKKLISDASSPEHVQTAQINLAEMYLARKQIDAAAGIVSDILAKDGRNISGLKIRAAIEMERGQLDAAIADLRQALNDQPRAADLLLMLAAAYEHSGSIDLAEKEFADAMKVSNYDPGVSISYVQFLVRRGSVAHAEDILTDLASRYPKNASVLSLLAQVRLARQEWVGAQEIAETLKRLGTNRTIADQLLGAALAGRKNYEDSIVALQDAYTSAPNAVEPMYALVRVYLRAEKKGEAINFLRSVLKASPSNAEAYVLLGSVLLGNGAVDQARQNFMTAIARQPKDAVGYRALADLYSMQKNYEEALKVTRAGLNEQPDSFSLRFALAGILERAGDYEHAIFEYEGLLSKNPDSIIVVNNLASLLADHRTDKASLDRAAALAVILRKSPIPQFKDTIGWISYLQGDAKTALRLLEDAAAAMPTLALVHYHLGLCYGAVGQPDKAGQQFKTALEHATDHDLQEKIRAAQAKNRTQ